MLLVDFYTIDTETVHDNIQTIAITLNPAHEIFKGHFPDNPVTPGVCMLHIIKEVVSNKVGCSLLMKKASNVKFLAVINPDETPELVIKNVFKYVDDEIKVTSTTMYGDTVALKVVVTYIKL